MTSLPPPLTISTRSSPSVSTSRNSKSARVQTRQGRQPHVCFTDVPGKIPPTPALHLLHQHYISYTSITPPTPALHLLHQHYTSYTSITSPTPALHLLHQHYISYTSITPPTPALHLLHQHYKRTTDLSELLLDSIL